MIDLVISYKAPNPVGFEASALQRHGKLEACNSFLNISMTLLLTF